MRLSLKARPTQKPCPCLRPQNPPLLHLHLLPSSPLRHSTELTLRLYPTSHNQKCTLCTLLRHNPPPTSSPLPPPTPQPHSPPCTLLFPHQTTLNFFLSLHSNCVCASLFKFIGLLARTATSILVVRVLIRKGKWIQKGGKKKGGDNKRQEATRA